MGHRYPELVPLSLMTSEVVAYALVRFISRFGILEEIITDRGENSQFPHGGIVPALGSLVHLNVGL